MSQSPKRERSTLAIEVIAAQHPKAIGIDIDFKVQFHDGVVVVPRGGGVRDVNVKVTAK